MTHGSSKWWVIWCNGGSQTIEKASWVHMADDRSRVARFSMWSWQRMVMPSYLRSLVARSTYSTELRKQLSHSALPHVANELLCDFARRCTLWYSPSGFRKVEDRFLSQRSKFSPKSPHMDLESRLEDAAKGDTLECSRATSHQTRSFCIRYHSLWGWSVRPINILLTMESNKIPNRPL